MAAANEAAETPLRSLHAPYSRHRVSFIIIFCSQSAYAGVPGNTRSLPFFIFFALTAARLIPTFHECSPVCRAEHHQMSARRLHHISFNREHFVINSLPSGSGRRRSARRASRLSYWRAGCGGHHRLPPAAGGSSPRPHFRDYHRFFMTERSRSPSFTTSAGTQQAMIFTEMRSSRAENNTDN